MNPTNKAILVNASILAGILIMYFRGSGIVPVVISGVILLSMANILMILKARSRR